MRELGVTRSKSRLLTLLLAFLLPGAGHLYIGYYTRGLLLFAGLLIDGAAIVQLANANGARHLLFIVYLGLALPVFYFFSVFDSLQNLERSINRASKLTITNGLLIILSGMLLLLLIKPPEALIPWMNELADFAVGPLLMVVALYISILYLKGAERMFKLGRFTFALFIIIVGSLLLWDQIQGSNEIVLIGQWWPVIFILFGVEITVYSIIQRKGEKRLRLDFVGGILAIVIALSAYTVTQYAELPFRWLDQYVDLNGNNDFGDEKGFHFEKQSVNFPLEELTSIIKINNPNGKITVRSGDSDQVVIESEVWVDVESQDEADQIAANSYVEVATDKEKLSIVAKGELYGNNGTRKPRIDMIVTVPNIVETIEQDTLTGDTMVEATPSEDPDMLSGTDPIDDASASVGDESTNDASTDPIDDTGTTATTDSIGDSVTETDQQLSITIDAANGSIATSGLIVSGGLRIKSVSGKISVSDLKGSLDVSGINGDIDVHSVTGYANVTTKNGTIAISDVVGNLQSTTINGSVDIKKVVGTIEADTKNGKIRIEEAGASVNADTLNGGIEVTSSVVGGDWDLDSSVGEIKLNVPANGPFSIYGSVTFGSIITDLPLTISKKTVRGTVGEGTYRIQINATNSISILQNGPLL